MITKIILEAIVYTLLYSAFMLLLFKFQGAKRQLYNYPPAIRECAIKRGITTQEELDSNAKKNKLSPLSSPAHSTNSLPFLQASGSPTSSSTFFPCLMHWWSTPSGSAIPNGGSSLVQRTWQKLTTTTHSTGNGFSLGWWQRFRWAPLPEKLWHWSGLFNHTNTNF